MRFLVPAAEYRKEYDKGYIASCVARNCSQA